MDMEEDAKRDCPQDTYFVRHKVSKVLMELHSDEFHRDLARSRAQDRATKPERAGDGAGRGESESDRAGSYRAHARRTWIGTGPLMPGAGHDIS